MFRTIQTIAVASCLAMTAVPSSAAILTLPFVGDVEHPDLDPFHMMTPEKAAAAAPAAMPKKHHKMKKRMAKKKKM